MLTIMYNSIKTWQTSSYRSSWVRLSRRL